jgi:hypothetical protein
MNGGGFFLIGRLCDSSHRKNPNSIISAGRLTYRAPRRAQKSAGRNATGPELLLRAPQFCLPLSRRYTFRAKRPKRQQSFDLELGASHRPVAPRSVGPRRSPALPCKSGAVVPCRLLQ